MSTQLVKDEIKKFLNAAGAGVLCIRGKWGTGKTFMWDEILLANKTTFKPPHYAYVSLFGLTNLAQVKAHVYQTNIAAAYVGEEFSASNTNAWKDASKKVAKKIVEGAGHWFGLGEQVDGLAGNLMTNKLLVCIDDLERIGGDLTVADVLGYATFLSKERSCKVVILLNDEALEGDEKKRFEGYLEKVVDVRLRFAPTPEECAKIAVDGTDIKSELVRRNCIALGIDNVRVITKIYAAVEQVEKMLEEYDPEVFEGVVNSVVLFGWSIHQPEIAPTIQFLQSYQSLLFGTKDETQLTEQEAQWRRLVEPYPFSHIDDFDKELIKGIDNGYFDPEAIGKHAADLDRRIDQQKAMNEWQEAWGEWRYSFKSSADDVVKTLTETFLRNIAFYSNDNLNSLYDLCIRMRKPERAKEMLDAYIAARKDNPEAFSFRHAYAHGDDFRPEVRDALRDAYVSSQPKRGFEDLLMKISEGWDSDAMAELDQYPVEAFVGVFQSYEGEELRKRIVGLSDIRRVHSGDPHQKSLIAKFRAALLQIGETSEINAERIAKTWGVKPDEPEQAAEEQAPVAFILDPEPGKPQRPRKPRAPKGDG